LTRDYVLELALFRHCYPGADPEDETVASFNALVAAIPPAVKEDWGYKADTLANLERQAVVESILGAADDGED
jgi:hypothetical protein